MKRGTMEIIRVIIDGNKIRNKEMLHSHLRSELKLPEYYGNNLDAFYDCMSTDSRRVEIIIKNRSELDEVFEPYMRQFIFTLLDLMTDRPLFSLHITAQ